MLALSSASCDITHETGSTICYGHWVQTRGTMCYKHSVLRLVISYTRQGVRFVTGIGSASCDITHETRGTICYGHWVLRLVISHTRQGVRFVTRIGFCVL